MSANVRVEAENLFRKLQNADKKMQDKVKAVIAKHTNALHQDIVTMASVPVSTQNRKGQKVKLRSKRGQPPRKDTGREVRSIKSKLSPKGWVGSVSTGPEAQDAKGRRYPWMNEAGSENVKKRPLFKKAQKLRKRLFAVDMLAAVNDAVRSSQ